MSDTGNEDRPLTTTSARLGVGSWVVLIVLLLLLVATGVAIYFGWTLANGIDVPTSGYAAMVFGVFISLAIGFGLMALLFYSSRKAMTSRLSWSPLKMTPWSQRKILRQLNIEKAGTLIGRLAWPSEYPR